MVTTLAGGARRRHGHRRGPGLVGEPRGRVRLPRRRPRDHQPDRARGPGLEPRRDRADGRGRGPATSSPRTARTASCAGSEATLRRPRRASRRRRLADRDAQRDPAGPWPRLVRGGDRRRRAGRQRAGRRALSMTEVLTIAGEIEGHPTTPPPRSSAGSSCRPRRWRGVEAFRFDSPRDLRRSSSSRTCASRPTRCARCSRRRATGRAVANLGRWRSASPGLATRRYDLLPADPDGSIASPRRPRRPLPAPPTPGRGALDAGALGVTCPAPARPSSPSSFAGRITQVEAGFVVAAGHGPARTRGRRRAAQRRRPHRRAGMTPVRRRARAVDAGHRGRPPTPAIDAGR